MKEKLNELLMDFNKINKECDELYHCKRNKNCKARSGRKWGFQTAPFLSFTLFMT